MHVTDKQTRQSGSLIGYLHRRRQGGRLQMACGDQTRVVENIKNMGLHSDQYDMSGTGCEVQSRCLSQQTILIGEMFLGFTVV
jgi:hypothetical protein